MEWSNFQLHGDAPTRAFEALVGVLFERWCKRKYPTQIRQFVFVNGDGGDGGVEAYAELTNGDVLGLQAKYFRNSLSSSQLNQIKESLKTAVANRKCLVSFIVAIPRDLSDGKTTKKQQITERERWDTFITESKQSYPFVSITLWGESQIAQLLSELASEGLQRYWFQGSVVDFGILRLRFEQASNGWLKNRYLPDLHQSGLIEADLYLRLNGTSKQTEWIQEARKLHQYFISSHQALLRLRRYPQFMQRSDAEELIQSASKWLTDAIAEQEELEKRLIAGNSFLFPSLILPVDEPYYLPLRIIDELKSEQLKATKDQLKDSQDRWYQRKITPQKLLDLGKLVAYVGEPGIGKTHALASSVQKHLKENKPAILLRAKDVDLSQSWDTILAASVSEPTWNAMQVLDALEAMAIQSEIRATALANEERGQFVRALIAIDGLDESINANQWVEKLGELLPLADRYPRILFAVSLRNSLASRVSLPNKISQIWLRDADVQLANLFKTYCQLNHIECSSLLRWALGTPLAIRLFAELYKEQTIGQFDISTFSIQYLINKKIDNLEIAIRESDAIGWSSNINPVRDSLIALIREYSYKNVALNQDQALEIVAKGQRTKDLLSRSQLLNILEKCSDAGLLLQTRQSSEDPFEGEIVLWEPAYETITDYLLAWEAYKQAKNDINNPNLPKSLRDHLDAVVITVYLLGMDGYDFFTAGLWAEDLDLESRENLRLRSILAMSPTKGEEYRDWVIEIFKRNMPSCRKVLDILVVPGLRIPNYQYGAKFVHDVLLPMSVASRDIFWSVPDYLPHNHGAPWEGFGEPVLEKLEIADDDPWDTAPLLLAWGTTTVKNESRQGFRVSLASWGCNNATGLLSLLQVACQTNDPQMKEDLLSVAYGSSCLIRPDQSWLLLCEWLIDNILDPRASLYTHDVIVRHSARSLIERCIACGVVVNEQRLNQVRKPYVDMDELLDINLKVAKCDEPTETNLLTYELSRYVIPQAVNPFFHDNQYANLQIKTEEEDIEVDELIWKNFAESSIRLTANNELRVEIQSELEQIQSFRSATEEERIEIRKQLATEFLDTIIDNGEDENTNSINSENQQYSDSAYSLLKKHESKYDLQNLKPINLAQGFISKYAFNLGWDTNFFIAKPNGGKPEEIIGVDVAISRRYDEGHQGSRSPIATFAEKYVWAATNELIGYFADRVAAHAWQKCFEPPVSLSLFCEVINPAATISSNDLDFKENLDFSELIPDIELTESIQMDRANEWVRKAPLPDIETLLFPNKKDLPILLSEHEWIILRAFIVQRNSDSQADSVLRTSSFVVPTDYLPYLEEDAKQNLISLADISHISEFRSGIVSVECYRDPCEISWANWIDEEENIIEHATLDSQGNPIRIDLRALTCQFHWHDVNGEQEQWFPSKELRDMLGIVDFRGGQFLTNTGSVQALALDGYGQKWDFPSCNILLAKRDSIFELLQQQNLTMGWGMWLFREAAYPLNVDSGKERVFRNWKNITFWTGSQFKVIPHEDVTELW
jgi:hypothetical protein